MSTLAAEALGGLVGVVNLVQVAILVAFFALAARALLLLMLDRRRSLAVGVVRVCAVGLFLALGLLYASFSAPLLVWDGPAAGAAILTALLVLSGVAMRRAMGWAERRPGAAGFLAQLVLVLALLLVASLTLMRAGFLALTEDRPILLVDVTGETATQTVRWAPPDQPAREERLRTHRVVFRTPDGVPVAEAWLYGDQVGVKGRVLRLSPLLNAAGVPNLFELLFAHNGYATAERHATQPHVAVSLPPGGPLAVHPWWRRLQSRLLERWERGTAADSSWAVRSATIESTYFPLADASGKPVRATFRLVLTPGGLSSG
ncbi:MAG TPA: hypothetical protein VGW35_05140 [Methylomirabilota bacterium]|nr:hypothetical protein [Methylomirabilota bacterium]